MFCFKNSNPKKTQEVPVEGRGWWVYLRGEKKSVEKFFLNDQRRHCRGDGGTLIEEMAAEKAVLILAFTSLIFLPPSSIHQIPIHNHLASNTHFAFNPSINQSSYQTPHAQNSSPGNLCFPGVEIRHTPQLLLRRQWDWGGGGRQLLISGKLKGECGQWFVSKWARSTDPDIKPLPIIWDVTFSGLYLNGNYNQEMESRNGNK